MSTTYGISSDTIDYLFSSTMTNTQAKMDSLAGTILSQGIDFFQNENYASAAKAFKEAAALSPQSDNAFKAYDYLGQAYNEMGDTDAAIKAYQAGIKAFSATSNSDATLHVALGDLYLQNGNLDDAIDIYKQAIRIDPNDSKSRYSLGQAYLKNGNIDEAYQQFSEVVRISPKDPAGYYGLGAVARAEGDLDGAVTLFNKSISLNNSFELSHRDLGYTYADQGEMDKANSQLSILENNSSDYTSDLETYIANQTQPKIIGAYSSDGFINSLGPKTPVSNLNTKLSEANKSKLFSMTVTFSKEMDTSSVVKTENWAISRATLLNNGWCL